jgi:hypothetical protein
VKSERDVRGFLCLSQGKKETKGKRPKTTENQNKNKTLDEKAQRQKRMKAAGKTWKL